MKVSVPLGGEDVEQQRQQREPRSLYVLALLIPQLLSARGPLRGWLVSRPGKRGFLAAAGLFLEERIDVGICVDHGSLVRHQSAGIGARAVSAMEVMIDHAQ